MNEQIIQHFAIKVKKKVLCRAEHLRGKAKNEPASKLRRDGKSPLSVFTSGCLMEATSRVA
jgi:hypothetical protein